jgi:hypothetical protein
MVSNGQNDVIISRLVAIVNILRTMVEEQTRAGVAVASSITPSAPVNAPANVPVVTVTPLVAHPHSATITPRPVAKATTSANKTQNTAAVINATNKVTKPIIDLGSIIKHVVSAVGSFFSRW